jgi:drug/metabolite transporter (DMT)-like permease
VIYGIGAALGWGFSDVFAALAGRRAGSTRTALLSEIASLVLFALLIPVGHPHWGVAAGDLLLMVVVGFIGAVGYLAIYAALTAGPLALVSPIVAAYSAVVIALSLLVLDERLGVVALAGASVVIAGVALASADPGQLRRPEALRGPGVKFALVAMLAFGFGAFGLGRLAQRLGWFLPAFVSRAGTLAVVVAAFALRGRTGADPPGRSNGWIIMAVVAGALDVAATVSFVYGSQVGLVSLVAAASAAYPLVPVVVGIRLFREQVAPFQLAGTAAVIGGLVVLAFR